MVHLAEEFQVLVPQRAVGALSPLARLAVDVEVAVQLGEPEAPTGKCSTFVFDPTGAVAAQVPEPGQPSLECHWCCWHVSSSGEW